MSNERSPRESCCTTTGMRGIRGSFLATCRVRVFAHGSLWATRGLPEATVPVVIREVVLPVPRERAWELITEPSELEEWLGDEVEFEAEVDAPVRVDEREGVVEEVSDLERIVFRWGDSRVEWVL